MAGEFDPREPIPFPRRNEFGHKSVFEKAQSFARNLRDGIRSIHAPGLPKFSPEVKFGLAVGAGAMAVILLVSGHRPNLPPINIPHPDIVLPGMVDQKAEQKRYQDLVEVKAILDGTLKPDLKTQTDFLITTLSRVNMDTYRKNTIVSKSLSRDGIETNSYLLNDPNKIHDRGITLGADVMIQDFHKDGKPLYRYVSLFADKTDKLTTDEGELGNRLNEEDLAPAGERSFSDLPSHYPIKEMTPEQNSGPNFFINSWKLFKGQTVGSEMVAIDWQTKTASQVEVGVNKSGRRWEEIHFKSDEQIAQDDKLAKQKAQADEERKQQELAEQRKLRQDDIKELDGILAENFKPGPLLRIMKLINSADMKDTFPTPQFLFTGHTGGANGEALSNFVLTRPVNEFSLKREPDLTLFRRVSQNRTIDDLYFYIGLDRDFGFYQNQGSEVIPFRELPELAATYFKDLQGDGQVLWVKDGQLSEERKEGSEPMYIEDIDVNGRAVTLNMKPNGWVLYHVEKPT